MPLFKGDYQLPAGQAHPQAAMRSQAESDMGVRPSVREELPGALEPARGPSGADDAQRNHLSFFHRTTGEVDIADDQSAVLDQEGVQAEELLDGPGQHLRVRQDATPVAVMDGEVMPDVAESAAGRVEAGQHDR